jgi:acetate kinase
MPRILCINAGSTSLKVECYELSGKIPDIGDPPAATFTQSINMDDAKPELEKLLTQNIDGVAHRIVHLPRSMSDCVELDETNLQAIDAESADAPLHNAPALRLVRLIREINPRIAQYGVSDSGFHRTLSPAAKTYALPRELSDSGLERIGYHGLSHQYAAHRACYLSGMPIGKARIVTAHLGGGSSLCAIAGGQSIDTTMGFTPLDGVPMATRCGSIDPGILLHLLRKGWNADSIEDTLEKKSGLLGISGRSGDVRELLAADHDPASQLALEVLAWRVRAAIGSMTASLGGLDLLVFTGGIGENAPSVRNAILQGGLGLNVALDSAANDKGNEGQISLPGRTNIYLISAREGWQLARNIFANCPYRKTH